MRSAPLRSVLAAGALCAPWMFAACTAGGGSTPPSGQPPIPIWPTSPQPQSEAEPQPPAISGGTLLVLNDGHTAVAADSDQDVVWFVDLTTQAVVGSATHALVDVGTGGMFKVPSLIAVGYRAPYLHDGCAATLLDRFTPSCGGGDQHGTTSQLSASQLSDLVAYLESL